MKARCIRTTVVKLELTEAEVIWLKDYMQNSLMTDEDTHTKNMREKFFTTLSGVILEEEKENEQY